MTLVQAHQTMAQSAALLRGWEEGRAMSDSRKKGHEREDGAAQVEAGRIQAESRREESVRRKRPVSPSFFGMTPAAATQR